MGLGGGGLAYKMMSNWSDLLVNVNMFLIETCAKYPIISD